VGVPYQRFLQQCTRHDRVIAGLPGIDVGLQKLLAELVLMRLFDDLQEALSGIALRLACGATYADGVAPRLLTNAATSVAGARALFENHGRPKPQAPKWSKTQYINDTTKNVLDLADHFGVALGANSLVISEMQAVRNRIAHNNGSARKSYGIVIRRHYGASLNHVTPGLFLMSPRFTPLKLESYVTACKVIAKTCSRS
jgi:hypothetical protein